MNRSRWLAIGGAFLFVLLFTLQHIHAGYQIEVLDADNYHASLGIALDSDGIPQLLTNHDWFRWSGSKWERSPVDLTGGVKNLFIDTQGRPHFISVGLTSLHYGFWNGTTFLQRELWNDSSGTIYDAMIEAPNKVLFCFKNSNNRLIFMSWDGAVFSSSTITTDAISNYPDVKILVDSSQNIHVIFSNNNRLYHAELLGGVWRVTNLNVTSYEFDAAFDKNGNLHIISYSGGRLDHHLKTVNAWTTEKISDSEFASPISLKLGPRGQMSILWKAGSTGPETWYYLEEESGLWPAPKKIYSSESFPYWIRAFFPTGFEEQPTFFGIEAGRLIKLKKVPEPNVPTRVALGERHADRLVWTWNDNASDESGYRVINAATDDVLADLPLDTKTWTQQNVAPNSRHGVYVEAYNSFGSVRSTSVYAYSFANPPTDVRFSAVYQTSFTVTWERNGNPEGVEFLLGYSEYNRFSDPNESLFLFGPRQQTVNLTTTFTRLHPGQKYFVYLTGKNEEGLYNHREAIIVSTETQPGPPPYLPRFSFSMATGTGTIRWQWSDESRNVAGYIVRNAEDGENLSGTLTSTKKEWLQTGLTAFTTHQVYIESFNQYGSVFSKPSDVIRTDPYPVADFRIQEVGISSISVSWSLNGNPPEVSYEISHRPSNGSWIFPTTKVSSGGINSAWITGLNANTNYDFQISYSEIMLSTRTLHGPPPQPVAPWGWNSGQDFIQWIWSVYSVENVDGLRLLDGNTFADLSGPISPNAETWIQDNLAPGASYRICLEAFNAYGSSRACSSPYDTEEPISAPSGWSIETIYGGHTNEGSNYLYFDVENKAHLVVNHYFAPQNPPPIMIFSQRGGGWINDGQLSFNGVQHGAFFDSRSRFHVLFSDIASFPKFTEDLYYSAKDEAGWSKLLVGRFSGVKISNAYMVPDTNNVPQIFIPSDLTVDPSFDGSLWRLADIGADQALEFFASFHPQTNIPWAVYWKTGAIYAAYWDSSNWNVEEVTSIEDNVEIRNVRLTWDLSNNRPVIYYTKHQYDASGEIGTGAGSIVTVFSWSKENGEWKKRNELVPPLAKVASDESRMVIGPNGHIFMAVVEVQQGKSEKSLVTLEWDGSRWESQILETKSSGLFSHSHFFPYLALNHDGKPNISYLSAKSHIDIAHRVKSGSGDPPVGEDVNSSTFSVTSSGGEFSFANSGRSLTVQIPPQAFGEDLIMTLQNAGSLACSPSPVAQLQGIGVGMEVLLDKSLQPNRDVTLTVSYQDADVNGVDENKLVLARCDTTRNAWVSLETTPDPLNNRVVANTNHFSVFQVMQMGPATSVDEVKAYPNPLRPARGKDSMTFASLPEGAKIKIYTLAGELLRELVADGMGKADWNGKNNSGEDVASGVYIAFIEGNGGDKSIKVALQR